MLHKIIRFHFTFSKWEQAASQAVLDHDFPIVFLTTKLEARIGNTPNSATKEENKVDSSGDLQYKIFMCSKVYFVEENNITDHPNELGGAQKDTTCNTKT